MNKQDKIEVKKHLDMMSHRGRITPEDVVNEAQNPSSPLHRFFEWSDKEAAHQYRLQQARELIREVKVQITTNHVTYEVPAYVRDPNKVKNREQGYVSVTTVRKNTALANQVITTEFDRIESAFLRARELAGAFGLEGDIDNILSRLEAMRQTVDKAA